LSELKRSVSWFTVVGAAAALTHYCIAVGLEAGTELAPAWANLAGFLFGFPVSYFGHKTFSFAQHNTSHSQALPRFFMVAAGGFIANQVMVLAALHITFLPFWLVLGIVMMIVAISSYVLGRRWAFKSR